MTQFRMRFYRDIARLRYLVESHYDGISGGMFLAVVDEPGYVVRRRQRVNEPYATYDGVCLAPAAVIAPCPGTNGCEHELRMPCNRTAWRWSTEVKDGRVVPAGGLRYFWLEPMLVQQVEPPA